jgi:hypothetical protein
VVTLGGDLAELKCWTGRERQAGVAGPCDGCRWTVHRAPLPPRGRSIRKADRLTGSSLDGADILVREVRDKLVFEAGTSESEHDTEIGTKTEGRVRLLGGVAAPYTSDLKYGDRNVISGGNIDDDFELTSN